MTRHWPCDACHADCDGCGGFRLPMLLAQRFARHARKHPVPEPHCGDCLLLDAFLTQPAGPP